MEFISKSEKDTDEIAKKLIKLIGNDDIVLLRGDLGAGKTTLVKSFVKALKGDYKNVTSPTFTIVNEYKINGKMIFHLDLYRIKSPDELINIGFDEILYSNNIKFIEWPERAEELFDMPHKVIEIYKIDDSSRKFVFTEVK